jgi:integrase
MRQHPTDPRRWIVIAYVGRDQSGRKKYRQQTVVGGKREAEKALAALLAQKGDGTLTPRSKLTMSELAAEWLEHKARDVSPRTVAGYRASLERHVLPTLGRKRLTDVELRDIDQLYGLMLSGELPRPDGERGVTGRPLSARTVRLAHTALSQALSQAVKWGMIRHNPAAEATLPAHRPSEKEVLTASERARFLVACRDSFYGSYFRTLLDTGLRPGEACDIKWSDVDFERGTITVQGAVTKDGNEKPIPADTKTRKSRRTVPMLAGLREELLRHLDWQRERGLDAAGFVFTNQEGRQLRPWTFNKRDLKRTLIRAGITKNIPPYSLRHTMATLHVAAGTHLKVLSDLLGHATIQLTANTYAHVDDTMTAEAMRRFERALDAAQPTARELAN